MVLRLELLYIILHIIIVSVYIFSDSNGKKAARVLRVKGYSGLYLYLLKKRSINSNDCSQMNIKVKSTSCAHQKHQQGFTSSSGGL